MLARNVVGLARMDGGEFVPPDFEFDGCSFAPDKLGSKDLLPACCVHDHDYFCGGLEQMRLEADRRLRENLKLCKASACTAGVYFRRVRFWGCLAYSYWPGKRPVIWWLMLRTFFTRWFQ